MSDIVVLPASSRDRVGKGSARAARREGRVPAVIYGDKKDPLPITVEERVMMKLMHTPGFFASLLDVEVNGSKHRVLPRDLQLHPVTDRPEHVDFLRVSADTEITVEVPCEFINEGDAPGLVKGGVLNVVRYEVEVICRPDLIPEKIVCDLSGMDLGDSFHISGVSLPDGVVPTITDRDFTIATIAAPSALRSEKSEADDDGGEAAEEEAED